MINKSTYISIICLLLSSIVVGCGSKRAPETNMDNDAEIEATSGTGVQGQVFRGPVCPGPVRSDRPCPDLPFLATFNVFEIKGKKIKSFQTDEQGRFRVSLIPGEYTIVPGKSAPILHPTRQTKKVTVKSNEFTRVRWVFDTGIR